MKDELSEQQTQAILKALDEAIEKGPWEESNFLRVIGKNLREIRETFATQLHLSNQEQEKVNAQAMRKNTLPAGTQEIFIALYSSTGSNLQSWERILINLPRQIISRPIYAHEKDVREIIKTKENKKNEAYVSFYVNQSDILPLMADKTPIDKLGKPLLSLKDKSLQVENIRSFVHQSGTYTFTHGRLIKNNSSESDE